MDAVIKRRLEPVYQGFKWLFRLSAVILISVIPQRLTSHDVALGFPFAWHIRQEVIAAGERPHTSSFLLLVLDFSIGFFVIGALTRLLSSKKPIRPRFSALVLSLAAFAICTSTSLAQSRSAEVSLTRPSEASYESAIQTMERIEKQRNLKALHR